MNNAIELLFEEHEIITSAAELAKQQEKFIGVNNAAYESNISELIDFFRNYADKYHHHKEEEILFPEMNKKNELLEDGVIKEMLDNHEDFRDMLGNIERLLDIKEYAKAQQRLVEYTEALLDHIAVENEEVFQMAETLFDDNELERLYFNFEDIDRELGEASKQSLAEKLQQLMAGSDA